VKGGHHTRELAGILGSHRGLRHRAPVVREPGAALDLQPQARATMIHERGRQPHGDSRLEDAKELSLQGESSPARVVTRDVCHRSADIDDHAEPSALRGHDVAPDSGADRELTGQGHRRVEGHPRRALAINLSYR
jgi:hypothetical protein